MAGKNDSVRDSERFSIITNDLNKCYICGQTGQIHIHEVFGGSNRAKSKQWGLCIGLCAAHHNMSNAGIHFNKELDLKVKQQAEKIWIAKYASDLDSREEQIKAFIKTFGRNYLDE